MIAQLAMAITFPLAAVQWARRSRPADLADVASVAWVSIVASITLTAWVLSSLHRLGSPGAWAMAGTWCLLIPLAARPRAPLAPIVSRTLSEAWACISRSPVLALTAFTVAAVGAANLLVIVKTAPATADVLGYHLPKMAYAIQSGTFDLPYANYWAQRVHPSGGAALLVYGFLAWGGSDHLLSLWQYASYWVAVLCVAGLSRDIGAGRAGALVAGCVFGLLTIALMQCTIAGNDLLLASHAAVCAVMIARTSDASARWRLPLIGLSAGAALATKALFLIVLPPLAVLFIVVSRRQRLLWRLPNGAVAVAAVGCAVMAAPAGFVDNARRWGHPFLGPPEVRRETTFYGRSLDERLADGTRNLARYTIDSLSADGLPRVPFLVNAYRAVRAPLAWIPEALGMDLESAQGTRASFSYDRMLSAQEAHAFWGILGVLLLWPAMLYGIVRGRGLTRALAAAGALGFPLQAYTALYDPWHGRYFLVTAVFVAPIAGAMSEVASWRRYAAVAIVIGCFTAVSAVLFRSFTPLVGVRIAGVEHTSVLRMDRIRQMTREAWPLEPAIREFERLVPADAVVQVTIGPDRDEYLFFGERLGRTLHPRPAGSPVPASHWLLVEESVEPPAASDIRLGQGLWLRRPATDSATASGR